MLTVLHSYALRDYPLEHVLETARDWPAVELSTWHFDDLAGAAKLARAHGVEIYCAGYWGYFADPEFSTAEIRATIDACAEYGISLLNGAGGWLVHDPDRWDEDWRPNGSAAASDVDLRRVADRYHEIADYGAARGVRIAVEVHPNTVHDTVAATAALLAVADHDNLVVTLDPANAAALSDADRRPDVIDPVRDRVAYFHLKNCFVQNGRSDFTVDAASGIIDNYRWLEALPGIPAVAVEYCGEGDPHPRLVAGRRYLEKWHATSPTARRQYANR
jgi:3-dehydroshikimate dehydratase